MSNRRTAAAALPMLHPWPGLRSPESVGAALLSRPAAVGAAALPRGPTPQVAVLSDGPDNSAWYEHRLLADAMGVPVVHPTDLRGDAGRGHARQSTVARSRSTCCTAGSATTS